MPRVNRDLQRRLAARRERERRRPSTERRYQFTSPNAAVEPVEDAVDESTLADEPVEAARPAAAAPVARGANTRVPTASQPAAPAARATARGPRPYSEYGAEYAYVRSDLRRVAAVVGSILVVVLVLYFVLPH
jgi:hypothetical protein